MQPLSECRGTRVAEGAEDARNTVGRRGQSARPATVAEAVNALSNEPFDILAPTLPNGAAAALHLAISDSTGDSAIFEYVEGKLTIHHGKQYVVMTNSPIYSETTRA